MLLLLQERLRAPHSSSLNSAVLLKQLQQQLQEQQQQHAAKEGSKDADTVSVACQTRQGDSWRMHSTPCQGGPQDKAQAWVQHGMQCVQNVGQSSQLLLH